MRTIRSSGRFLFVVASTFAAVRCYHPDAAESCKVTCNAAAHEACPDHMSCEADGVCHAPGDTCGGPRPDARLPDGSADLPCFGSNGYVRVCLDTVESGEVPLMGTIDTTTPTGCAVAINKVDQREVCVIAADSIDVKQGTVLSGSGSRPLVLVATDTITIEPEGELSVASTGGSSGPVHGPGANLGCPPGVLSSGGGGPGGSHGGNLGGSGAPSYGASAYTASLPGGSGFVGGCDGAGGDGGGAGGMAGGAVFLIAGQTIAESGTIDASGAGGGGVTSATSAVDGEGGGGAGAGGLIGLDAPTVDLAATTELLALGGGGGGGACSGTSSTSGSAPSMSSCGPAAGGIGNTGGTYSGGAGGVGPGDGAGPGAGMAPTGPGCGGGGGGGGLGVIVLPHSATPRGSTCGAVVNP